MQGKNYNWSGFRKLLQIVAISSPLILSACGDSESDTTTVGGGSGGGGSATSLSGTAAAGAAIIGQVTVKGSLGMTKSALIGANGNYNVDVSGLTAPYRLRAEGTVGGRTYKLHSYAEMADLGGNVNITPFTDLIVANAAQQIAESYFDSNTPADLDPAEIDAQEDVLQARLQEVFSALGVDSAIDLLRSTFSADHSGLDAALDVVRIETDPVLNVATITNLIDNTSIEDSVTDTTDNTSMLTVSDPTALTTTVTDIQAITAKLSALSTAFANGLPNPSEIEDFFSPNFFEEDEPLAPWLTDITTDPTIIGITFSGIAVSDLDTTTGTATVTFNATQNGETDLEPIVWFFEKDTTLGWQALGDQRIVESYFSFHCNDNDGAGGGPGGCGINTRFEDNDFSNNGTMDAPIASATVSIIDGVSGSTVKDVIYLGTCDCSAPGEGQVWDEGNGSNGSNGRYTGDYKGFGTTLGSIDPAIFAVGDIIQYKLYTQDLDVTTASMPRIEPGAIAVATYTDKVLFTPSVVGLYPSATSATVTAINNFTLGNDLTIAWTLAAGTRNDEILVEIRDNMGNRIETWIETFGTSTNSQSFASTLLDSTAATNAGLDATASSYNLLVRVYAEDDSTGQAHSRDYNATIPGPAATGGGTDGGTDGGTGGGGTILSCNYESGWDDAADEGVGRPITPNSFADYEATLADCGSAQSFTAADVAGKTFDDAGETTTFNALGVALGSQASRGTGVSNDGDGFLIDFQWWVEAATCAGCTYSYLVLYSDASIDTDLAQFGEGAFIRETTALTGITGTPGVSGAIYTYHKYSEQFNFSDTSRATGADGEIWFSADILQ